MADSAPIQAYIPVLIFFVAAAVLPVVLLFASRLVAHRVYQRDKMKAYECGVDPIGSARDRFSVRYYLIAMLFLIFDVETVFLFPWAIRFKQLGWLGAVEMTVFLAILLVGYFYAWKRKVLTWV